MNKRVLVFGANGQVGTSIRKFAPAHYDVVAHDRSQFDLIDSHAVERYIRDVNPNHIINCAAYTDVDGAEDILNRHRCWHANTEFPEQLAKICASRAIHLVHYSTDYVFNGVRVSNDSRPSNAYNESGVTSPVNYYGTSKREGELALSHYGVLYTVYRVSGVYSTGNKNFHAAILRAAKTKDVLEVVDDQCLIPTSSDWIAKQTWHGIDNAVLGLYHLVPKATGADNFYEFAKCIKAAYNLPVEIVPSKLANLNRAATRPAYTVMTSNFDNQFIDNDRLTWPEVYHEFLLENKIL